MDMMVAKILELFPIPKGWSWRLDNSYLSLIMPDGSAFEGRLEYVYVGSYADLLWEAIRFVSELADDELLEPDQNEHWQRHSVDNFAADTWDGIYYWGEEDE